MADSIIPASRLEFTGVCRAKSGLCQENASSGNSLSQ
jgi:hypothetical protein